MAAIISHLEAVAVVKKWFTAVEFSIYLSDCLVRWVVVVGRLKDGMEAIVDAAHIRSLGWRMALIFNNAAMCQTYQSEEEEEGYLPELVKYMNMIFFFPPTAAGSGWSYIYIYIFTKLWMSLQWDKGIFTLPLYTCDKAIIMDCCNTSTDGFKQTFINSTSGI